MVIINPLAVMQTRRYRFARRQVFAEISVIGVESPVDVVVRIVDSDRKVMAKPSKHVRCDVSPTTVCAGLMDAINRHSASKSKPALLNDDGELTELLTMPGKSTKDNPNPPRVDRDDVDWDAVRDRLVVCLPGYVDSLTAQAEDLRRQEEAVIKELEKRREALEKRAKQLEDQAKSVKKTAPKESKASAMSTSKPISALSEDQMTIPPSIPPQNSRRGHQK